MKAYNYVRIQARIKHEKNKSQRKMVNKPSEKK